MAGAVILETELVTSTWLNGASGENTDIICPDQCRQDASDENKSLNLIHIFPSQFKKSSA